MKVIEDKVEGEIYLEIVLTDKELKKVIHDLIIHDYVRVLGHNVELSIRTQEAGEEDAPY